MPPGGAAPSGGNGKKKTGLIIGGVAVAALVGGGLAMALSGGGDDGEEVVSATTTSVVETTTTAAADTTTTAVVDTTVAAPEEVTNLQLAQSTVQLIAVLGGEPCWTGSGSIVSDTGLILTNFHVAGPDPFSIDCPVYDELQVAITGRTDEPPLPRFVAGIVSYDEALDLAVVRITTTVEGDVVTQADLAELTPIALGDSDAIEVGDDLRIIGYPGIGGETVTFTEGSVSGFGSDVAVEVNRAWIKTDATIAGGNSGGAAINDAGELIGVPSIAGAGNDGDTVDCRFLADTNNDGSIDELDTCVPVGGFLNGLRPINLAAPLIAEGETAEVISLQAILDLSGPVEEMIIDDIDVSEIVVGIDGEFIRSPMVAPSGTTELCLGWSYVNFPAGSPYNFYWFTDGVLSELQSTIDGTWPDGLDGTEGVNICGVEGEPIPDGVYELRFTTLDETGEEVILVNENLVVGTDRQFVSLPVVNESTTSPICFINIDPSGTTNWGPDRLDITEVIDPGETLEVPAISGPVDIRMRDCDLNVLYETIGEDSITPGDTFTLSDQ
jgi:S1-C subfamily serine protease